METLFIYAFATLALVSARPASANELGPVLVNQAPDTVFTPYGFDDNDNVQVVVEGNLPDTCHKVGPVHVKVDRDHKVVFLKSQSYFYPGCWCAQVEVPYVRTVDLGVLSDGKYDVVVEKDNGQFTKMAELPIVVSRNAGPDDFLYAPVREAELRSKGDAKYVVLKGEFRNSCMTLKEVRVANHPANVLVVQPIAEMGTENCHSERRPFETAVEIKTPPSGKVLIHVRSLDGQAINKVVEL